MNSPSDDDAAAEFSARHSSRTVQLIVDDFPRKILRLDCLLRSQFSAAAPQDGGQVEYETANCLCVDDYSAADTGVEYCDERVCLSVCVFVCVCRRSCLRNYTSDLHHIFTHVSYDRGSVLLWRHSDTSCTYGFIDDVTFARAKVV